MSKLVVGFEAKKAALKSKFTEEFEQYLKKQSLKTTFNGMDLDNFNWSKKILGWH